MSWPCEPLHRLLECPHDTAAARSETERAGSRSASYEPGSEAARGNFCFFWWLVTKIGPYSQ